MSDVALLGQQVRYEQKSYWRNPLAAVFSFGFPLLFFFILVSLAGHHGDASDLGTYVSHGRRVPVKLVQYYTPSILAYAIMSACFLNVALNILRQREGGVLKRMRGTPLPAWAFIGGVIGSALVVATLLAVLCVTFSVAIYGAYFPVSHLLPLIVTIAVAAVVFCALGIAVSSLIPNVDSGPPIINVPFFILVFISGTYFPLTGVLGKISDYFPLRPMILSMLRVFDPTNTGSLWDPKQLGILVLWGIGSTIFAIRHFRWTPRRG
jgi:ABC-2 type transport system permease protein